MSSPTYSADNDLDTVFTPPAYEQWLESVLAGLPSDSTLEALQYQTLDGLDIRVLYHDSPGATEACVPRHADRDRGDTWDNRLCIEDTRDAALANRALHEGLQGGNTSVELHLDATTDIAALLKDVNLDLAPVSFRASHDPSAVAEQFLAFVSQQPLKTESLSCSFNADPLGQWLRTGLEPKSLDATLEAMAEFSSDITAALPKANAVLVDTALHHNAGASAVQELQAAIATGSLYLTHLLDSGMTLAAADRCIVFQMACDADVLMGTIKLRSLRILWAHVVGQLVSAGSAEGTATELPAPAIVAETSRRYLSRLDPWNNHLRNITACSAAAMGGAATIIVHPHDRIGSWQSLSDPATGIRMARNLPIILERESWLTHVKDPMAGSFAVETLTTQLTELTWQALADMGDLDAWLAAIRSGMWQKSLADTQHRRSARLSAEQQVVVGVNRYVDTGAADAGRTLTDSARLAQSDELATAAMLPVRDAEPFERQLAATQAGLA